MKNQELSQLAEKIISLSPGDFPMSLLTERQWDPSDIEVAAIIDSMASAITRGFCVDREAHEILTDWDVLGLRLSLPDRDYIPTLEEALHDTLTSVVHNYLWDMVQWRRVDQDDPFYGVQEMPWT